jgi:broad specificity phosphatase PhoE
MRLLLLRHAESRPDHALPEADWPLSDRGREQAHQLIEPLAAQRPDHLFSSPFRRALDTVAPFALWSKRAVAVDPAFVECTFRSGYVPDWPAPIARAWADRTHTDVGCESATGVRHASLPVSTSRSTALGGRLLVVRTATPSAFAERQIRDSVEMAGDDAPALYKSI